MTNVTNAELLKMDEMNGKRIYNLVKEEYSKMKFSKKYSNRARLSSKCEDIIYNKWGIGHDNLWKTVDIYVEELIPEELD